VGKWGQRVGRRRNLPIVSTAHTDYELYADRTFLPNQWVEAVVTHHVVRFFNLCHVVTTPIDWMRRELIAGGVTTPVELLPNPVDLSKLGEPQREATRKKLGLTDEDIVVGYLGRLSPVKRLPILIEAVDLLKERRPEVRLVVVGDGVISDEVRKLAKKTLGERVMFTGSVPHSEVAHYHAAFDVFATASRSETQPLAYTEAMYVGTPVVALATPGAAEMIVDGENGLLVPPDAGAEGMAGALETVLGEPALAQRLREGGRHFAETRHFTAVAERLEEIYSLAADRAASGW
jgi:glycosyltransferase involved in cell wall biosynthesis